MFLYPVIGAPQFGQLTDVLTMLLFTAEEFTTDDCLVGFLKSKTSITKKYQSIIRAKVDPIVTKVKIQKIQLLNHFLTVCTK
jgi:hypothetical protein